MQSDKKSTKKIIKQRGKNDCVIAALANALSVDYKSIKKRFGVLDRNGMVPNDIDWIVGEFCNYKKTYPKKQIPLISWAMRHRKGRFLVIVDMIFENHAAAVVDGMVASEGFLLYDEFLVCAYYRLEK